MNPVPLNIITEVENYVLFTPPHAFTWSLYVNLVDVSALVRESALYDV